MKGLRKMVSKSDKGGEEGITQYSDITNSVLHANHLLYSFMFLIHNSYCLLYHLFQILMSIKNLQMLRVTLGLLK